MNPKQAKELGQYLRGRRDQLGFSVRDVANLAGVDNATVVRLEQGAIAAPSPAKLAGVSDALLLRLADVFALAGYVLPNDLPAFAPYLRTRYRNLPMPAHADMQRAFARVAKQYGYDADGPAPGEDEQPEAPATKPKKGGDRAKKATQPRKRRRT